MATLIGAIVGAAKAALGSPLIDPAYENGRVARLTLDYFTGDAAQNDVLILAKDLRWDTILDPLSSVDFDDMGTGVNVDIGFLNDPDALVDGQDVSTAAGSVSLLKTVTIVNRTKPLWALAGYATKKAAIDAGYPKATITLTFVDGNPASGNLAWRIYGSPQ